jgi:hypothetical protein
VEREKERGKEKEEKNSIRKYEPRGSRGKDKEEERDNERNNPRQ